jgi:UDP-N-acetylenolpyruvoylglucosamine reductase
LLNKIAAVLLIIKQAFMKEKKEQLIQLAKVRDLMENKFETINEKELNEMILKNNALLASYKDLTKEIKKRIEEIYGIV